MFTFNIKPVRGRFFGIHSLASHTNLLCEVAVNLFFTAISTLEIQYLVMSCPNRLSEKLVFFLRCFVVRQGSSICSLELKRPDYFFVLYRVEMVRIGMLEKTKNWIGFRKMVHDS